MLAHAKDLAAEVREAEAELATADEALRDASLALSNIVEPGVPEGGEDDFALIATVGTPPSFDFTPRDHVELGKILGAIDVERAAKVSGSRFYYLTGVGALLELALVNMAMMQAVAAGFIPMLPPALVRSRAMEGTGFLGQAAENVFRLEADDYYLVGTAEVPLAAYRMDETLAADELPLRYVGFSPCFRREAGTYGKDTKGIIRVHQFDKVEMFTFCAPEDAVAEHQRLLGLGAAVSRFARDPLPGDRRRLGRPRFERGAQVRLRSVGADAGQVSRGHLDVELHGVSGPAARTSGCATRDGVRSAATLNGTLVAIPRTIVAILENHQQADGSVVVPAALRPYLGRDVLEPIA